MHQILYISDTSLIAELAELSPIIIQISSNQLIRKNLDVRPYDPTTVRGATFNMRDQLYRGHFSATALSSSPVVSALGSGSDDPDSSPGKGKALCPWDVREKKMRAPLLGLAKSIRYLCNEFLCFTSFTHLCGTNYKAVLPRSLLSKMNVYYNWLIFMPVQSWKSSWF